MYQLKKFGDPFKKYEPLEISHISVPDTAEAYNNLVNLGVSEDRYALPDLSPPAPYVLTRGEPVKRIVLTKAHFSDEIKKELKKAEVGVAPVANVYKFSPEQPDLSDFIKQSVHYFNYYLVELGLSVAVGREAKIPKLKYEVDLYSDEGKRDRTDVTTFSVAPTDRIKRVKIIEGKISIGINNLLKLIPGPIGKIIPNLMKIDINPIEFRWALRKYEIDVDGPLDYNVSWKIYGTEVVQSFNPLMILRARKEVSEIFAYVRILYELKTGLLGKLPGMPAEAYVDERKVDIFPP